MFVTKIVLSLRQSYEIIFNQTNEMPKKNLIRICTAIGATLSSSDLSADEKKALYAKMATMGATDSFTYNRFFKEGFSEWELDGIIAIKADYLKFLHDEEKIYLEVRCVGERPVEGDSPVPIHRYFYRIPPKAGENQNFEERSFDLAASGDFWRFLGDIAYRKHFGGWMASRGMKAYITVARRFTTDDWKEWERVGIRQVIQEFMDE